MNTLLKTDEFSEWLENLRDSKARNIILARLRRASLNDFGDCGPIGDGVSEMRIHYGPGYRVYFFRDGATVYILLGGGTKRGQDRDIKHMLLLVKDWKRKSER